MIKGKQLNLNGGQRWTNLTGSDLNARSTGRERGAVLPKAKKRLADAVVRAPAG